MATQVICDQCGEPIDLTQPYYQVTAVKVKVENANDPSQPNQPVTVEIPQQFDYHDGHQPQTTPEEPVEPPVEASITLTEIDPPSVTQADGNWATLWARGSGFDNTAKIVLDGTEVPTNFATDAELSCTIDATPDGKTPGTYDVLVRQGGAETQTLQFTIEPPA